MHGLAEAKTVAANFDELHVCGRYCSQVQQVYLSWHSVRDQRHLLSIFRTGALRKMISMPRRFQPIEDSHLHLPI